MKSAISELGEDACILRQNLARPTQKSHIRAQWMDVCIVIVIPKPVVAFQVSCDNTHMGIVRCSSLHWSYSSLTDKKRCNLSVNWLQILLTESSAKTVVMKEGEFAVPCVSEFIVSAV